MSFENLNKLIKRMPGERLCRKFKGGFFDEEHILQIAYKCVPSFFFLFFFVLN